MTALLGSGSRAGRLLTKNALNRLRISHMNFVSRSKIVVAAAYKCFCGAFRSIKEVR